MSEQDQTTPESTTIAAAAVTDGAYTLLVADFSDTDLAWQAYEALEAVEDGRTVEVEGVIVVKRSAEGELEIQKATDHSTKSGLKWGVVGGAVLGVIFPPSILASAVATGAFGAAIGKAHNVMERKGLAEELAGVMRPNTAGIIALVENTAVVEIRKALDKADRIVEKAIDEQLAKEIDREAAAAKESIGS